MTGSNAPPFDPLNPTPEEEADMLAGYLEGAGLGRPEASLAYAHGRANRVLDIAGAPERWQLDLAARDRREGKL